jgi:hypothetical protein
MSIKPIDTTPSSVDSRPAGPAEWERTVRDAVRGLRYGSVEVQVHDGRVVQVETREKVRFADDRRPDRRRRSDEPDGRAHRNAGGTEPTSEETNE